MTPSSRTKRTQRADAAFNREAIIAATASALATNPDASIDDIASAAGLSRRALYGHFSGRDELVEQTLIRGAERLAASVSAVTHPDARVELALLGASLWAEVEHTRAIAHLAIRGPHRVRVSEALAPLRTRLESTIKRGVHDRDIRTDILPTTLARLVEGAALTVLDEATRTRMSRQRGHRLIVLTALSTAGMSWRAADELMETHSVLHISAGANS